MECLEVFCADIGSINRECFAWARRHPRAHDEDVHSASSIEALADAVSYQLDRKRPVALGLETPLFVPVPDDSSSLGKARPCDVGAPAWSSNVGASVMATGLVQAAWLLARLHTTCPEAQLHLRWETFEAARTGLLLWEAFISGTAKGQSHEEDAQIGVRAFCAGLPWPGDPKADDVERPICIAGAAALWAGWKLELECLRSPCVLIRA